MASVDNLLRKYKDEIDSERSRHGSLIRTQVARDPNRRPWHLSLLPAPEPPQIQKAPAYLTHWRAILAGALICGLLTAGAVMSITPYYSSSLHLFLPEKIDSMSTRMTLLTNQLDFASLPAEFKLPMGLLSRRLQEDRARQWVIEHYLADRKFSGEEAADFDPSAVGVETFYAQGSDLLIIRGLAGDPKAAAKIASLYWKYLERELDGVRRAYLARIQNWISIRENTLDRQISDFKSLLLKSTSKISTDQSNPLTVRMKTDLADLEMKKIQLDKERELLKRVDQTGSFEELENTANPEIKKLLDIYRAIDAGDDMPGAELYQDHLDDLEREIRSLIKGRLSQLDVQLQGVALDLEKTGGEFKTVRATSGLEEVASEDVRDLQLRLRGLESQRGELEKLKTQLDIESLAGRIELEPVRLPVEEPDSLRPPTILSVTLVILGVCVGGAAGLAFVLFQSRKRGFDFLRCLLQRGKTARKT